MAYSLSFVEKSKRISNGFLFLLFSSFFSFVLGKFEGGQTGLSGGEKWQIK